MRTLIKDGTIVTASDTFVSDVWIEGVERRRLLARHPAESLGHCAHGVGGHPCGEDPGVADTLP